MSAFFGPILNVNTSAPLPHSHPGTVTTILSRRNGRSVDVDLELDENDLVVGRYFHYRTLLAEGRIDMV
jgi:hypothetical protein